MRTRMDNLWHFPLPSGPGAHLALAREQVAHALTRPAWLALSRLEAEAGLREAMFKFIRD